MCNPIDLPSKFLGSMVGSALGDAIGELAFRYNTKADLRRVVERRNLLAYTDDTAMAIGLAQSLTHYHGLDPQHLGQTFHANYLREPWRGYASGPPTIFQAVEREGLSYTAAARRLFGGSGSYGNGAAMRVAPLGLFFYDADADTLYEQARRSASVTHAHPIGVDGAAVLATAVARAVALAPTAPFPFETFAQALIEAARTPELRGRVARACDLARQDALPKQAAWRWELGDSVAMHHSLPFALYAYLRHPDDFEACLMCAALYGGDRDTLAAMACAISGAALGINAIPPDWRVKLENRAEIERLARGLVETRNGNTKDAKEQNGAMG